MMWSQVSLTAIVLVQLASAEKEDPLYLFDDDRRLPPTEPFPHGETYTQLLKAIGSIGVDRRGLTKMTPKLFDQQLPPTEGPLKPNTRLDDNTTRQFDFLSGPESIHKDGNTLYAAASDAIYRIDLKSGEYKVVYDGNVNCESGKTCSRPLGLRTRGDRLLCADALQGLIEVNLTTGESRTILAVGVELDGSIVKFPDDIDVDWDKEVVYMSDGSTKWPLRQWMFAVIESDSSSRIIRVDLKTGKADVFAKNIRFANGVQISHDKKFLLVSEFSARRILKFPLDGPMPEQTGSGEAFIDLLIGNPDNIRPSMTGGYWVALPFARSDGKRLLLDELQARPELTRRLGNSLLTFGELAGSIATLFPNDKLHDLATELETGHVLMRGMRQSGMILELDANGNILQSLQSSKTGLITEVLEHEDGLYCGSFSNKFILSVPRANFRSPQKE